MKRIAEKLISSEEGFSELAYRDKSGAIDIGPGINLEAQPIPNHLARTWETIIVLKIKIKCLEHFPWYNDYSSVRKAVIIDMIYNLGFKKFNGFTNLLHALSTHDIQEAGKEMLNSKWHSELPDRSEHLHNAFIHNSLQTDF